jgi:hypothetical protein
VALWGDEVVGDAGLLVFLRIPPFMLHGP